MEIDIQLCMSKITKKKNMSKIKVTFSGVEKLERELNRLNSIRWEAVRKKQTEQMMDRAQRTKVPKIGGTPVDTGELRLSLTEVSGESIGYEEEYAPHVEYGHESIRKDGKKVYVKGQHFLFNNARIQEETYKKDLRAQIRKERGK